MSSLIFNERVVAFGAITENETSYVTASNEVHQKHIMDGAFLIDAEPTGESALGWAYVDGQFIAIEPEEVPEVVTPPAPTKEELLAKLQEIQTQIQALG